jgi:probable rRNA maturation factor
MRTERSVALTVEVQYATEDAQLPSRQELRAWARAALQHRSGPVELVIRVVGEAESRELNGRYRGKDGPTNVLSFPFEAPAGIASQHVGDLVICAPVVKREALEQHKKLGDHWAHMVVHGVLHLCGHDHQTEREARQMESLERQILEGLGIPDPYAVAMQGEP